MKKSLKIGLLIVAGIIILLFILKITGVLGSPNLVKISTEKAELRTITEIITANGKIQPETEVKISSDVSGEIIELYIEDGQEVKAGDLMLKIKPDIYLSSVERATAGLNQAKAQLAQAKARLIQAEAAFEQNKLSFERNKKLYEQKTISKSEFEQIKSNYISSKAETEAAQQTVNAGIYTVKSAEASLKEAHENLKKTGIYAPMSGTVSQLNVEKGERVVGTMQMAGTQLLRIAQMDRIEVVTQVNENDIIKVNLKDTAIVEVDAYLDRKFKGIVSKIANSSNNTNNTLGSEDITNFEVKILLLSDSYSDLISQTSGFPFRPGMSATVDIQTKTLKNIVTVPIKAVTTRDDTSKINNEKNDNQLIVTFKYNKDNTVSMQTVKTGIQDDEYIQIISGLKIGDEVVTEPYDLVSKRLRDKQKVNKVQKESLYEN